MRIISKFKDYYDSAMQYGQDSDVVWVREREEIKAGLGVGYKYRISTVKRHNCEVEVSYVAFCGKFYPIHQGKVSKRDRNYQNGWREEMLFASSKDELEAKISEFYGEEIRKSSYHISFLLSEDEKDARVVNKPTHDLHRELDCPVIHTGLFGIIKCPILKDIQFQRVKDPYTAFQEISMYISGVMGQTQNPMVTLSDKSKVIKRGFDPKYGFRTRPKEGK